MRVRKSINLELSAEIAKRIVECEKLSKRFEAQGASGRISQQLCDDIIADARAAISSGNFIKMSEANKFLQWSVRRDAI